MKFAVIVVLLVAILATQVLPFFMKVGPAGGGSSASNASGADWQAELKAKLPALGEGNWIVIADSAFPALSGEGVTTLVTGKNSLETLKSVLQQLNASKHLRVRSVVESRELDAISEDDAKGVLAHRIELKATLKDTEVDTQHQAVFNAHSIADHAKEFNVLVLKTDESIPFSTLILHLGRANWDEDKEDRLNKAMRKK